jgi:hypothetical protein
MDCLATVFMDKFSNFLIFLVILVVLDRPGRSSSLTVTRPALKCVCHSETSVQLTECSQKALQSISRISVADLPSFTRNLMQTCCLILPSIADKTKHKVKKALV